MFADFLDGEPHYVGLSLYRIPEGGRAEMLGSLFKSSRRGALFGVAYQIGRGARMACAPLDGRDSILNLVFRKEVHYHEAW